jgi:hypothetical protein
MTEGKEEVTFAGVSLDTSDWVDPSIKFPGEIVTSEFREGSDEYREAYCRVRNIDLSELTEPIPQWQIEVKRLDAIAVNPDGSEEPSIFYATIDLKKWSNETKSLVPLSSRNQKEHFIVSRWTEVFMQLQPPSRLVGLKGNFEFWPTKAFGSFVSKRVLVPTGALDESFQFTGEVRRIPRRPREDEGSAGTTDAAATAAPSNGAVLAPSAAVLAAIAGLAEDADQAALLQAIPAKELDAPIVEAVTSGSFISSLIESGTVKVEDGKIVVA